MHIEKKTLRYVFTGAIICILLYWILHEPGRVNAVWGVISGVFSPFVLGASMAFILNVPMRAFEKLFKGIKNGTVRRIVAVTLTIVAVLLVLALMLILLIPQLANTVENLIPQVGAYVDRQWNRVVNYFKYEQKLISWDMISSTFEKFEWASLLERFVSFISNSLSVILTGAFSAIGTLLGAVVDGVIAVVFAIYCLFQKENLARQGRKALYAYLPENVADYIIRVLRLANSTFSNFLSGQCVEVCILGSMFAICMAIFGMPHISLISVLIAITAFIPVVGAWVGCFFGTFFILVTDPTLALWFVVMFVILQQIENNVIYPRVVGTSIGLSGMWVLLAVAVGGELLGVAGMFLMIPAASVIYALLREVTANHLKEKNIDPDKLRVHPPEISSRFKENRDRRREKRKAKNAKAESNSSNDSSSI